MPTITAYTADGEAQLKVTGGTLSGVTLDANATVQDNSTLTIQNGLMLNGTLTLTRSGYYNTTSVDFASTGTQTLSGTGQVAFNQSGGPYYRSGSEWCSRPPARSRLARISPSTGWPERWAADPTR